MAARLSNTEIGANAKAISYPLAAGESAASEFRFIFENDKRRIPFAYTQGNPGSITIETWTVDGVTAQRWVLRLKPSETRVIPEGMYKLYFWAGPWTGQGSDQATLTGYAMKAFTMPASGVPFGV